MTTSIYQKKNNRVRRFSIFLSKSFDVHGTKYDYSDSIYKSAKSKIIIICPKHGSFLQSPNNHLSGFCCKECSIEKSKITRKNNISSKIIKRFKVIHKEKYDYTQIIYTRSIDKIEIVCPDHGSFWQTPNNHLSGKGCPTCANENRSIFPSYLKNGNDICYLYKMEFSNKDEVFYKTGITININRRLSELRSSCDNKYKIKILELTIGTRYDCYMKEQKILSKNKSRCNNHHPKYKFSGHTECYNIIRS